MDYLKGGFRPLSDFPLRGIEKPNSACLAFEKFLPLWLVVLERRQPSFVLRTKKSNNFSKCKVEEFKQSKFLQNSRRISNLYLRIIAKFNAEFSEICLFKPCVIRLFYAFKDSSNTRQGFKTQHVHTHKLHFEILA